MIYTLEYLNEEAEIEIARFDTETRKVEMMISGGSNVGYVEPKRSQLAFGAETSEEIDINGRAGRWTQNIGHLTLYEEKTSAPCEDAYIAVRDMLDEDSLINLFDILIKNRNELKSGDWLIDE